MVNTIPPKNAVMNLKFPDVLSLSRKSITNAVHRKVLSDMFLLEWLRNAKTCGVKSRCEIGHIA
jgi:hypothetical protein